MASNHVKEQALLLGPRRSLVAIVSTPARPAAPDAQTVVILNSGIVHRVGSSRLSVSLARALAAVGLTAVRFDMSGIGDSDPRADTLPPGEAGLADIREALDSLEAARGTRRVILAGLCSGADFSVVYSGGDRRVVGAALIDPAVPHTFRHYLHYYVKRLARPASWLGMVRGKNPLWARVKRRLAPPDPDAAREPSVDDPEARAYLERAYASAVRGRVRLLAILTGMHRSYREELLHAFPAVRFGELLRLEYLEDADHLFMDPAPRARLIAAIVNWAAHTDFAERREV